MGTSGAMVFVIDGERKAGYTHFDGYPDGGLGSDLLAWLHVEKDKPETYEAVRALKVVNADSPQPTPDEIDRLRGYANLNVSGKRLTEWYCLLRECQGNPALTLEAGYIDATDVVEPYRLGYGNEYTYVVDFDAKTFTAWGHGKRLGTWSFAGLPTKEQFIDQVTEDEDE